MQVSRGRGGDTAAREVGLQRGQQRLGAAPGGAEPLLATLEAYFSRGGVAAAAARDLHLSVRAVTYRLARVRDLTGRDPGRPADALTLQVAVIGARLLNWPATPLAAA